MIHNLVLPDEYDRINLDLAPFFALPKAEMKRRMEMVENMKETFTLIIREGRVEIQVSTGWYREVKLTKTDTRRGWPSMGWDLTES
jgi:hypothetical protein